MKKYPEYRRHFVRRLGCCLGMLVWLGGCRSHNVALLDAIERQEVGNVKRLLDGGAKADVVPDGGAMFPLEAAAKGGNAQIVKLLLQAGAHPDSARGPEPPLWWAMINGHEEAAILLVGANARLDGPLRKGIAPFYFAVMQDDASLVTKMIAHKVDVNARGPNGSPLHEAADNGNLALARLLVAAGADVNRANDLGETPLFLAIEKKHWEVANWLVTQDANINFTNNLGQTVLHSLALMPDSSAIQHTCALFADPNVQNLLGETPLHIAAANGNLIAARTLLDQCNADLNLRDVHNLTPAGLAYREDKTEMVDFLTNRGGRLR